MQAIGSAFASVGLVFLTARCEVALSPSLPASSASVRSNHYRKTTLINHSLATPYDRCAVGPFHETRHVYLRKTTVLLMRCEITCSRMVSQIYIRLFHHEGSTKSITDKKYKSDRTRARGMYKNIKSYLTNTFKPT